MGALLYTQLKSPLTRKYALMLLEREQVPAGTTLVPSTPDPPVLVSISGAAAGLLGTDANGVPNGNMRETKEPVPIKIPSIQAIYSAEEKSKQFNDPEHCLALYVLCLFLLIMRNSLVAGACISLSVAGTRSSKEDLRDETAEDEPAWEPLATAAASVDRREGFGGSFSPGFLSAFPSDHQQQYM